MVRLQRLSVRTGSLLVGLVLGALLNGCGSQHAAPRQSGAEIAGPGGAASHAKLQPCFEEAKAADPNLSVHTDAWYFARDNKVVFVDVELPGAPQLAACLRQAILGSSIGGPPVVRTPGSFSGGGMPIDWGPPETNPKPRLTAEEFQARHRRVVLEALRQGALRPDDPPVRELLNPAPPWPTVEMRAELEACHRAAPELSLQRIVMYLTRGGRVLLADVSIPENLELQRCVLQRIAGWASPFSSSSETVLSSFLIELGEPEERAVIGTRDRLQAELARRDALVRRALELGLIKADDPLFERLRAPGGGASTAR